MAIDRPADDDPEEISGSLHEKRHGHGRQAADGMSAESEIAETRTPAEYYQALRAAVDQQSRATAASASADNSPRSAWDDADPRTRPPLDALRIPLERAIHILDGDATGGGGHRYGTGKPGKTEFPASWDDDKITDSILSVARSPDSVGLQKNGRWKAEGVRDGVMLAVIIMADGRIWSAYPLPGSPGVRQNPRNR